MYDDTTQKTYKRRAQRKKNTMHQITTQRGQEIEC